MTKAATLQLEIDDYLARVSAKERDLQDRIDAFEEKKERRRDRLEAGAAKARAESSARLSAARRIGDAIPFGQPILVGHHSEGRHRRDIKRIDTNMRKGFEASDRAADLSARAASVGTGGISSDDPVAVQKLRTELAEAKSAQEKMKAANAAIRKHAKGGKDAQGAALAVLGYSPASIEKLLTKDFAGRIGFADYQITNNGSNIRRIEKRIEELTKRDETPARAPVSGSVEGLAFTISESKDANRTQIVFSGKPSDALRSALKSAGFKWAPTVGAWQRQLSNQAWHRAAGALGIAL